MAAYSETREPDTKHNPEFTLLEIYQAFTNYEGMMELTETMFREVARKVLGTLQVEYDGEVIDLEKPFARITMIDAVKKYSGVDFREIKTDRGSKGSWPRSITLSLRTAIRRAIS